MKHFTNEASHEVHSIVIDLIKHEIRYRPVSPLPIGSALSRVLQRNILPQTPYQVEGVELGDKNEKRVLCDISDFKYLWPTLPE